MDKQYPNLGEENGKQLVETLVYLFGLHFALRGGKEQRHLRSVNPQVVLKYDEKGKKYLEYTEDVSKTNAGGLNQRKTQPKKHVPMKILMQRVA